MNLSTNAIERKEIVIFVTAYQILFVKIVIIHNNNKEIWLCTNHWKQHAIDNHVQ